jgi:hypothetical protein
VPGIALAYLWVAPRGRLTALRQLLAGGAALAAVGLAWPILVTLTPAADRPWISGTSDNSIWSLIFSYNGVGRVTGQTGAPGAGFGGGGGGGGAFGGATGVFRLLSSGLGDQAGWLLGFAVVAGLGVLAATRLRRRDPRTGWLIAVGGAFLISAAVFSYASGIFHPYYVSFLAPFTAMLIGAGVGEALAGGRVARVAVPAAIVAGAITELVVLGNLSGALSWARPLIIAAAGVSAILLAAQLSPRVRAVVVGVALAALLAAPATWAAETIGHATASTFPAGGPASAQTGGFGGPGGGGGFGRGRSGFPAGAGGGSAPGSGSAPSGVQGLFTNPNSSAGGSRRGGFGGTGGFGARGFGGGGGGGGGFAGGGGAFGGDSTSLTAAAQYAKTHGGGTVGVESQGSAASAILASDANVAGLGGFSGRESTVSAQWLAMEVRTGRLRWILAEGQGGSGGGFGGPGGDSRQGSQSALAIAEQVGTKVTFTANGTSVTMYDLHGKASAILAAAAR